MTADLYYYSSLFAFDDTNLSCFYYVVENVNKSIFTISSRDNIQRKTVEHV